MAFSEVYQAMQTGVVDGSENTLPNFWTQKFYEVQKYVALTYHGYDGYAVIVNKKFWEGLPAELRATLEKAMQEATDYENELSLKENDEDVAKIKAANRAQLYEVSREEQVSLRKPLLPVHKQMESRIGKEWIDAVYKVAAAAGVTY